MRNPEALSEEDLGALVEAFCFAKVVVFVCLRF